MHPRECTMADGDTIDEILAKEPCVCWSLSNIKSG